MYSPAVLVGPGSSLTEAHLFCLRACDRDACCDGFVLTQVQGGNTDGHRGHQRTGSAWGQQSPQGGIVFTLNGCFCIHPASRKSKNLGVLLNSSPTALPSFVTPTSCCCFLTVFGKDTNSILTSAVHRTVFVLFCFLPVVPISSLLSPPNPSARFPSLKISLYSSQPYSGFLLLSCELVSCFCIQARMCMSLVD